MDWKKLVELAAPAAAGLASHGNQAGVLRGFMAEQERIQQERQIAAQRSQQHKQQGATMSLELMGRLQQETDPLRFQQLRDTITKHADAYGIDPAEFASMPLPDGSDAKLKELSGILSGLEKVYDLDQLSETGASVTLKDGTHVPVSDAVRLTRVRPMDGSGNPIPAPKKADVQASTDYGRFLARYAKDKGKKVDDLTAADELDAKAQFGRSDDAQKAPVDPQVQTLRELQIEGQRLRNNDLKNPKPPSTERNAAGLTPQTEFSITERLAKAWTDSTKSAREMDRQYSLMQTGLDRFRKGDKNGGSQAVLVTFQKILDPTSVVRESEYARSSEGISLLNRMQGSYERLASGGAGVTDGDLAAMVETAKQFVDNMKTYTHGQRSRIDAQVKKYKLDPATVFDDVLTGSAATSQAPSGPAIGERRTINGQLGEWDGKGWKAAR